MTDVELNRDYEKGETFYSELVTEAQRIAKINEPSERENIFIVAFRIWMYQIKKRIKKLERENKHKERGRK